DYPINELKKFDLKGRGGAEFPTWKKWSSAKEKQADEKILLCNADEGEPGSYKDRDLLLKDPYKVIEGMIIGAYCIGAKRGYIYIREEYDYIRKKFIVACEKAKESGFLGENILGEDFDFNITVHTGAGAYVCGENSALIESMQGRVGRPKLKPPRVGEKGLFDLPTMVNNVETFSCVATILIKGAEVYGKEGTKQSIGTKVINLSGNIKKPGTYEIPFGVSINDILYKLGEAPDNIKFIQTGGASGPLIPRSMFDLKYTYEDFKEKGFSMGSGSIIAVDDSFRVIDYLIAVEEFFKHESCGKCTPCREGLRQIVKILHKVADGKSISDDYKKLYRISHVMIDSSFCGLGETAPTAILTAFKYFGDEIGLDSSFNFEWEDEND
ncbi:MAG: NADH-ubiquinone oxidoreductase-F iron-sulfur binding region domain-containing protein, partial [Acidaminobacteraceae bacterium]